jgi:1-deoxyxylulose-5-phosphate synthase
MDDRANIGQSESVLGRAIKGKRDQVVITSKVAGALGIGANDSGLSRLHILREVEHSLKRLDTDYIDIYLVHVYDATTPQEETIRALDDLVRSGKVRYIGCCNYTAWQVCLAHWIADIRNASPFMCVQNPYSLLNRRVEQEMFGLVRELKLGYMAYSPLAVGLLSGAYAPGQPAPAGSLWATRRKEWFDKAMIGDVGQVIHALHRLAAELGKTPAQLAIAWILSHPEVTVAISGADTIEQFDDVLGGVGWSLDPDVRRQLDEVSATLTMTLD